MMYSTVFFIFLCLISSVYSQSNTINKFLIETYGTHDLAEKPAFQGGYINFGYWKDIALSKPITKEERIEASKALYELVFSYLNIQKEDHVAEIGCGAGNGCALVAEKWRPASIVGVDIISQQIERANKIHTAAVRRYAPSLSFQMGSSDALPFPDNSQTKIFSVEAAQCFPSMSVFAKEAWRVLKPGGCLVVTAHFATGEEGYQALRKLIPTVDLGVDRLIPIEDVRKAFQKTGFKEINFETIGGQVFPCWNDWDSQVEDVEWAGNIILAFKQGNMDYYLLVLEKRI